VCILLEAHAALSLKVQNLKINATISTGRINAIGCIKSTLFDFHISMVSEIKDRRRRREEHNHKKRQMVKLLFYRFKGNSPTHHAVTQTKSIYYILIGVFNVLFQKNSIFKSIFKETFLITINCSLTCYLYYHFLVILHYMKKNLLKKSYFSYWYGEAEELGKAP